MPTSRQHTVGSAQRPNIAARTMSLKKSGQCLDAFVLFLPLSKHQEKHSRLPVTQFTKHWGSKACSNPYPWVIFQLINVVASSNKVRWTEEVWEPMTIIPALQRLRQVDHSAFETNLDTRG